MSSYRERIIDECLGGTTRGAGAIAAEADAEIAALRNHVAELQDENFALSAAVCPMGFGDEGGTPRCCADAEIAALKAVIEEVHSWIVCAAIATPEDMMQNARHIAEITTLKEST